MGAHLRVPRRAARPTRDHELLRLAQEDLAARFATAEAAGDPRLKDLLAGWQEHRLPEREAAAMLLRVLSNHAKLEPPPRGSG